MKKAQIFAGVYLHARNRMLRFKENAKDENKITAIYVVQHTTGTYEREDLLEWADCFEDMGRWQRQFDAKIDVYTCKNEESKKTVDVVWSVTIAKDKLTNFMDNWDF